MRSVLFFLSTNRDVFERLKTEVDEFCERNEALRAISYSQTQQLPYLKAVVRESLRMYPSIPAQLYRFAPEGGLSIEGQHIAPGTIVSISPLAQNRDKAVYGEDADQFRGERWLEDEAKARHFESTLMNFGGSGRRSCPGKDLAMVGVSNAYSSEGS